MGLFSKTFRGGGGSSSTHNGDNAKSRKASSATVIGIKQNGHVGGGGGGGGGKSRKGSKAQLSSKTQGAPVQVPPPIPMWDDAWKRTTVEPEEVQELLRICTAELKSRALDLPFLLLPFRPASDPSAARTFIRNFFSADKGPLMVGSRLEQELLLTEPMVISSVMKWCWSRLSGGVVSWEAYELFRVGEQDSDLARDAFATFIPLSVDSDARTKIIFDFFDLLTAIAAHGKTNGMGGRKLSRFAGWWAFEQVDTKSGFDGGYRTWSRAAEATSHLFFAYLRSLSPGSEKGINGISGLPLYLQTLVLSTAYPPPPARQDPTSKVAMVVDHVSPTPFALLRRAKHFEYRDDDRVLRSFSNFEDPVDALTDECRRVLRSISSVNESNSSTTKASTSLGNSSWSRFEDLGFGAISEYDDDDNEGDSALGRKRVSRPMHAMHSSAQTKQTDLGRPTTPSWADFMSSGFVDETRGVDTQRPLILPPDKILPPIDLDSRRGKSSQSHLRPKDDGSHLEPGELASINALELDSAFWWVWICSLSGEETAERKAVFGRCALIETIIGGSSWLVIEEMVKGAAPEPEEGAYIAEKRSRFTFGKKRSLSRSKSISAKSSPQQQHRQQGGGGLVQSQSTSFAPTPVPQRSPEYAGASSNISIGTDQHARIQAAARALQQKQKTEHEAAQPQQPPSPIYPSRRGRSDQMSTKTNSVFTLQPVILKEAGPAMQWAKSYDKKEIRAAYLGPDFVGKGSITDLSITALSPVSPSQHAAKHESVVSQDEHAASQPATAAQTSESSADAPVQPAPVPPAKDNAERLEQVEEGQEPDSASPDTSPESKRNRLQKKQGRNLKGLFRKKQSRPSSPQRKDSDPMAAAAARSALTPSASKSEMRQAAAENNASKANSITRRLSRIGRGKRAGAGAAAAAAVPNMPNCAPPVHSQEQQQYDTADDASQLSVSRASGDSYDQHRQAEREFTRFDQGPLDDQPAFMPDDDGYDTLDESARTGRDNTSAMPTDDENDNSVTPTQSQAHLRSQHHRHGEAPAYDDTATSTTISRPSTQSTDPEPVGAHYDPPFRKGGQYEPSFSSEETNARHSASVAAIPPTATAMGATIMGASAAGGSAAAPAKPAPSAAGGSASTPSTTTTTTASPATGEADDGGAGGITSAKDRWAQIRKNAAERAAARFPSDDAVSRQGASDVGVPASSTGTAGAGAGTGAGTGAGAGGPTSSPAAESTAGLQPPVPAGRKFGHSASPSTATAGSADESGEETIESRVARIKARVAELTGNMQPGGKSSGNASGAGGSAGGKDARSSAAAAAAAAH